GPLRSTGSCGYRPSSSLPRREERQLEPADLDLVTRRELGLVDLLAVDVGPVEAPDIANEPGRARSTLEHGVLARDGDVVEEHGAVRAATDRGGVVIEQEG